VNSVLREFLATSRSGFFLCVLGDGLWAGNKVEYSGHIINNPG
jgi:hypothetical protein